MDYDFSKQERGLGKIVFALMLDRKKMTERIVIGEMNETRRHLEQGTGAPENFYYYGCGLLCPYPPFRNAFDWI